MSQQFGSPVAKSVAGPPGTDGKSAYDIAVINGFVGTESVWLASLKGVDGADGDTIVDQRTQQPINVWTGTQAHYDALASKDADTLYVIKL